MIRSAHRAAQYKAFATADKIQAMNPRQGWLTNFDREGFFVQPQNAGWSWGLQLKSYGFEGAIQAMEGPAMASTNGNRVQYDWSSNVQEWFVNDALGLEHGYTLQTRPTCSTIHGAPLVFDLAVKGSLHAEIMGHGNGVRFLDEQDSTVVIYSGCTSLTQGVLRKPRNSSWRTPVFVSPLQSPPPYTH